MNLEKLFQIQKVLRDRIGYNEPDHFDKLILALLVEAGECANEHRGFKFWSVNQLPHTSAVRVPCMMEEDKEFYNPLLEEFVDKLHFILELGLQINIDTSKWDIGPIIHKNITVQFIAFNQSVTNFWSEVFEYRYALILGTFLGLGEMLGFTWEQIEQAYLEKNKINHQRQEVGY
ncbi:dUTP diphosphatase [Neobacillus sp. MM2021_6]|uniref:dUTP diphosphatase n=1 Tax=Bacillaceae TaxID=186817 RepID=UPI00140B7AE6|nr:MULTISPECIES: dUTP diphosphatase [Bacillaceae]MBO0961461.1 dUTP diphosphatase [Neobacillus sp. MM2021_6]NHC19566.1 dUTPase [Bacillus sp. MM2020_4]